MFFVKRFLFICRKLTRKLKHDMKFSNNAKEGTDKRNELVADHVTFTDGTMGKT